MSIAVAGQKRHAGGAGHRRQELVVVDRELVVEAVARRKLGRPDQVADERHRAGADGPAPLVARDRDQRHDRPRPPRPEQAPAARPDASAPLSAGVSADRARAGSASASGRGGGASGARRAAATRRRSVFGGRSRLAFVAKENRVARSAALQTAAHALDLDVESPVAQTLLEPAIVPRRPDREDAARLERRARRRQPAIGVEPGIVRRP